MSATSHGGTQPSGLSAGWQLGGIGDMALRLRSGRQGVDTQEIEGATDVDAWKWGNPLILKESLKNCSDYMGFPLFFKRLRYLIPYRSQYAIGALLIPFLV